MSLAELEKECVPQSGWGRAANPSALYLLSALLMLVGCFLVGMPYLFRYRQIEGLATLLGVIQIYEALVIGAAAYVLRRGPTAREAGYLLLIELLFLFDASFTANACLNLSFSRGLPLAAIVFLLAILKLFALRIGGRRPVFAGLLWLIVPALVYVYGFQLLLRMPRYDGPAVREPLAWLAWALWGALPLFLLRMKPVSEPGPPSAAPPGWSDATFRRLAVAVVLVASLAHLVAQTWIHRAPFSFAFVIPAVFTLVATASSRHEAESPAAWYDVRLYVAILVAVFASVRSEPMQWSENLPPHTLVLSPMRLGLLFGSGLSALVAWRQNSTRDIGVSCGLLALAAVGHDGEGFLAFVREPDWSRLALVAVAAGLWICLRRTYWHSLVAVSALLWLAGNAFAVGDRDFSVAGHLAMTWPVAALALGCLFRPSLPSWLPGCATTAVAIGLLVANESGVTSLVHICATSAALAACAVFLHRRYLWLLLGYSFGVALVRGVTPAPTTADQWGALVVMAAFATLAFGIATNVRAPRAAVGPAEAPVENRTDGSA